MREEAEKISFSTDLSILHSFPASKQAKLSMMLQSRFHRPMFTETIPSLAEISIIHSRKQERVHDAMESRSDKADTYHHSTLGGESQDAATPDVRRDRQQDLIMQWSSMERVEENNTKQEAA
jgi:hypothetical protein